MFLKYIKHNFKVVSFSPVDHEVGLYKFTCFNSIKNQPLYSYASHTYEQSKLWHERSSHLNYGKMEMLTKMVLDLPTISSTKGAREGCVLGKNHTEMFY